MLEKLYEGQIYPLEQIPVSEKYKKVGAKIDEKWTEFEKKISVEEIENLKLLIYEREHISNYENFSYGFKLGCNMMMDCFN